MYEELVKRLRNLSGTDNIVEFDEAADAIEQLSNAGSAYGRGWTLGYDAGRAESKPRWIPVSEKLPEAGERVLCYCRANIYEVMKMRTSGDWVHDLHHIYMHSFVTHWMPLPKGPEEE